MAARVKENPACEKSFAFAVRIVKLCKHLVDQHRENVLSKQLLRSGTSIGANVNEAQAGQSRADFVAKMVIAGKEARETKYWLDLLVATGYLNARDKHTETLLAEAEEMVKILTAIVKTTQGR